MPLTAALTGSSQAGRPAPAPAPAPAPVPSCYPSSASTGLGAEFCTRVQNSAPESRRRAVLPACCAQPRFQCPPGVTGHASARVQGQQSGRWSQPLGRVSVLMSARRGTGAAPLSELHSRGSACTDAPPSTPPVRRSCHASLWQARSPYGGLWLCHIPQTAGETAGVNSVTWRSAGLPAAPHLRLLTGC
eukprot:COSAG06_NODE_13_length_35352_cov_49.626255_25_plen_189_part_00